MTFDVKSFLSPIAVPSRGGGWTGGGVADVRRARERDVAEGVWERSV